MNKKELAKRYGKERVQWMHYFLDKLNRLYGFPYSEQNLCDFIVSLSPFLKPDMEKALLSIEDRSSRYPLRFDEIKSACRDAKSLRKKDETMYQPEEKAKPNPLPPRVKVFLEKIFKKVPNE